MASVRAQDEAGPGKRRGARLARLIRSAPQLLEYAGSTAGLLFGSVSQLVSFAILARSLGPTQFGELLTITAITTIALNIVGLGSSEPMVRRVAVEPALYGAMLGHNLILSAGTAALVFPLSAVAIWLYTHASEQTALPAATTVAFAFANTVLLRGVLMCEQAFIARGAFGYSNFVNVALGTARLMTAALACLVFGVADLESWALWHLGGYVLLAAGCVAMVAPLGRPVWTLRRQDIHQGLYFLLGQLGMTLRQTTDILVLGLVAPSSVVGNFGIARRIADTSYVTINALDRIMYPRLAVAMAPGLSAGRPMAVKVAMAALLIALATAAGVFILAPVLPLIFGADYANSVGYVRALCFVVIPYGLWAIGAEALGASAHQGMRAMLINAGIVGVLLIAVMTFLFETTGTIIAVYIVDISLAVAFWWFILAFPEAESVPAAADEPGREEVKA